MKKIYIPIILSLIALFAVIFVLATYLSGDVDLTDFERPQLIINGVIAIAAITSFFFVIWGYLLNIEVFISGQKPHLLVQVVNDQNNISQTLLRYINITKNAFEDLKFIVEVVTPSRNVNLSDLFGSRMYMSGGDDRTRRFNSIAILKNKGFDLIREVNAGNKVTLTIKYTFTFLGERQLVLAQEYKWIDGQGWQLP